MNNKEKSKFKVKKVSVIQGGLVLIDDNGNDWIWMTKNKKSQIYLSSTEWFNVSANTETDEYGTCILSNLRIIK